jgi:hypothetical protein
VVISNKLRDITTSETINLAAENMYIYLIFFFFEREGQFPYDTLEHLTKKLQTR